MHKLTKIYTEAGNSLSGYLKGWAEERNIDLEEIDLKSDELLEKCDSLVILHENHDISKDHAELRESFDVKNKGVHKIDINGTMVVALSQFEIWVERNKIKNLLVLGENQVVENENNERFFSRLKLA